MKNRRMKDMGAYVGGYFVSVPQTGEVAVATEQGVPTEETTNLDPKWNRQEWSRKSVEGAKDELRRILAPRNE